jgi:hypothetical protein
MTDTLRPIACPFCESRNPFTVYSRELDMHVCESCRDMNRARPEPIMSRLETWRMEFQLGNVCGEPLCYATPRPYSQSCRRHITEGNA